MSYYDPNAGAPGAPYPSYPPPPPSYSPSPPAGSRTNGLAVASLVLGIVWLCGVGSILALVFGYMALSHIKRTGEGGRGMAIAGIVLGWIGAVTLVFGAIVVAAAGSDGADESSTGDERTETTAAPETTEAAGSADAPDTTAAPEEEGPITNSGNTENPPTDDVEVDECGPGVGNVGGTWVGATGTITNHSSEASTYFVTVEFVGPDGTRYDESLTSSSAVGPDQSVEWQAPGIQEWRDGSECRVTQVERFAA